MAQDNNSGNMIKKTMDSIKDTMGNMKENVKGKMNKNNSQNK